MVRAARGTQPLRAHATSARAGLLSTVSRVSPGLAPVAPHCSSRCSARGTRSNAGSLASTETHPGRTGQCGLGYVPVGEAIRRAPPVADAWARGTECVDRTPERIVVLNLVVTPIRHTPYGSCVLRKAYI